MKDILRLSLTLGVVCAVASAVLVYAENATKDKRETVQQKKKREAITKVLPEFTNKPWENRITVSVDDRSVTFYPAKKDEKLVGYGAKGITDKGYGGRLEVVAGMYPEGKIRAVVVGQHAETPGLGTRVTKRKAQKSIVDILKGEESGGETSHGLPPNEYLDRYTGRSVGNTNRFKATKEGGGGEKGESTSGATKDYGGKVQAVSGATISSRAVADAVSSIAKAFDKLQERKG